MVPLSTGKCEILYAKGLKFNRAHCRFAQHLIFLHHFSAEEKEFESVTPQTSKVSWSAAERRAPHAHPTSRAKNPSNLSLKPERALFHQRQPSYRSWRKRFMLLILEACRCSAFGKQRQLRVSHIQVLSPEHHSAGCPGTFARLWSPFKIPVSFRCPKSSRTVTIFCSSLAKAYLKSSLFCKYLLSSLGQPAAPHTSITHALKSEGPISFLIYVHVNSVQLHWNQWLKPAKQNKL